MSAFGMNQDPLAHKYPMNSPYVYCNGNPVRYVDPDGRWPWENRNIRDARAFASQNGFEVQLIDGKYGKDVIKDTGEKAIKSIDSKFSRNSTFNKFLNEVKSDFKSAGKPTQGHAARSQMNTEAKSRLKSEKSFQIGVSEIKTKLKEHGVDVSTGTAGTLINHKLSTHQDE